MTKRRTLLTATTVAITAAITAAPLAALAQTHVRDATRNPPWPDEYHGAKRLLLTGLDPAVVDYSTLPDLNADKLRVILQAQLDQLLALGYAAQWCFIDTSATAELKVADVMRAARFDAVLIGAGVRLPPPNFLLFERLVNTVHQYGQGARIVFNQTANDTTASVQRWI